MSPKNPSSFPLIRLRYIGPYLLIFLFVPIITVLAGKWIDSLLLLPSFPPFPYNIIIGVSFMLSGAAVGIKATRHLRRVGKGLPWGAFDKQAQSTILVTTGIYSHIRNPITLGYTLLPFGMGLLFRSLGMTIFIPLIILIIMIIRIKKYEEPQLEARFGKKYLEYKRKTPFLVPRVLPLILGLFARQREKIGENDPATS